MTSMSLTYRVGFALEEIILSGFKSLFDEDLKAH